MAESIRSFIAVNLSDDVRARIVDFQSLLKQYDTDIKWVRPSSLHITLKFLGDIAVDQIDSLVEAIQAVAEQEHSFDLEVCDAGVFPNERQPRILWLGIQSGSEILARLATGIDKMLIPLHFKPEKRPFTPHLTIGRVKSSRNIGSVIRTMHEQKFKSNPFEVNDITLMRSILKPSGAEYQSMQKIQLKRINHAK